MRYHFNITDGHVAAPDREGADLSGPDDTRTEALRSELLSEGDRRGLCRRHWRMDVVDGDGAIVLSLPFGHALEADLLRLSNLS